MQAQALWEQDRAARKAGSVDMSRQEYYNALRDALHTELLQDGRSDWLDAVIADLEAGTMQDIYLLDFAALMACHGLIVKGQPLRDTSRHVPYARSAQGDRLAWGDMRPTGNYRMAVPQDLYSGLQELRQVSMQLIENPDDAVAPPPERIAQRKYEQAQILNRHLEQQNIALIAERDALRQQIADMQAGYISETLRYAAEARRMQLEAELEEEFARERANATAVFRQQYARELADLEARRTESDRAAANLLNGVTDAYRAIRSDMQAQLRLLQEGIERQAAAWQQSLFRTEARLLAQSYVTLHALNAQNVAALLVDAQMQSSPLLPSLMQLQSDLHDQLIQLEQAMLRLGLQVERPVPGSGYDPSRHCLVGPVTDAVPPPGTSIRACAKPGVLLLREADAAPETLVHAEVTLGSPDI